MNSIIFTDGFETPGPVPIVFTSIGTGSTGTLNAWVQDVAVWSIASNVASCAATTAATMHAGHPDWWDCTFTCRFQMPATANAHPSIIVHFTDTSNYIRCRVDGTTLHLDKKVGGVATNDLATVAAATSSPNQYWLRLQAAGTLYTATVFNDTGPGSIGSQIATASFTITDAILQSGAVALHSANTASVINFGGAFANTCYVTAPTPLGWTMAQGTGEPAWGWSKKRAFTGTYSLSIFNQHSSAQAWWDYATIPTTATGTYTVAAYLLGLPGSAPANFYPIINFDTLGVNTVTDGAWHLNSTTGVPGANQHIEMAAYGAGTYYFDLVAVTDPTQQRGFASLPMDDNVNGFVREIHVPSVRNVQSESIVNRRRAARIREDTVALEFEVRGIFGDTSGTGKFWRDFKAALLNQVQQTFDHGDGTEFRSVDVLDVAHTRTGGTFTPPLNGEVMAYTAKCLSYEPYARSKPGMVQLSANQALTNGNGTFVTNLTVYYAGTAPGEPTWQVTLVVPIGVTATSVKIQNVTTGEICNTVGLSVTNGTYYLIMDSVGGGNSGNTPNNNAYSLLALTSNGYGLTLSGTGDVDFTGTPPTLAAATGVPPVPAANSIAVTVTANGALTSATLNYVAPNRWVR